jgi:hypothetical protein
MFIRDDAAYQPLMLFRATAATKLDQRSELQSALFRSLHWSRLARGASRVDRFLFPWMALETVSKLAPNDDIPSRLASALCLIKDVRRFDAAERLELKQPDLRAWRKRVLALADDCRRFRNAVVHSGFREFEALEKILLRAEHERLLRVALPAAQWVVCHAIALGMARLSEAWRDGFVRVIRQGYPRPFDGTIRETVIERLSAGQRSRYEYDDDG